MKKLLLLTIFLIALVLTCTGCDGCPHVFDSGTVTTEPTCSTPGVKTSQCMLCGYKKTETIPVDDNHTWNSGTVTKAATCSTAGTKTFTCTKCQATKTETIDKNDNHTWNSGTVTKAATCGVSGTKTVTCTKCQATKTESISPTGNHTWNSGTVTKAATCGVAGTKTVTCTKCQATKTESVSPTGNHTWNSGTVTKAATCGVAGTKTFTCTKCSSTKTESISATGNHSWNSGTISVQPTCTKEGKKLFTCSTCKTTKTETLAKIGENHTWNSGTVTKAATCGVEGVKTFTCTSCSTTKTEAIAPTGNHTNTENCIIVKVPTASTSGVKAYYCTKCAKQSKTQSITYTEYNNLKNSYKSTSSAFNNSDFGGTTISKMSTTADSAPTASPTTGQHPRLLFTAADLPAIREALGDASEGSELNSLLNCASEYDSGSLGSVTNHSSSDRYGPKGDHNCNEAKLRCITAKAFLYQIYGVDLYGYEAISMIKQYITTVKITNVNDSCRTWGNVMFVTALVYDWCYDLLTDTDKTQLTLGVQYKICGSDHMEVGFPPSGQGSVSGHGSERQILRDYLAYAIAVYDEQPTWYQYIGGRVYQDFIPVRNEYYKSDFTPQGISNYVQIRFTSDLWSAWLLKVATGTNPYIDNMKNVMRTAFSHIVNGGTEIFDNGDDELKSGKNILQGMNLAYAISGYLYDDNTMWDWVKYFNNVNIDSTFFYILTKNRNEEPDASERFDDLDLIRYNAGILGQMIVHNSWSGSAASTYMKIGGRITANHDHADAGSFQIYYKGLLTGETGVYDSYGSTHHTKYHQATIAHNSIVIKVPNWLKTKYTTYGQNQPSETGKLSGWQTSTYTTGTTTGAQYAYSDAAKQNPIYAYIAGNITPAYSTSSKVDYVERRMLTVYDTGNSSVPMLFFVYDDITTKDTDYVKTFLLHTFSEPTIDTTKKTVTTTNGSGRLVLQSVIGGDNFTAIGGTGNNYSVDGTQLSLKSGKTEDGSWGRVEISPNTGSKNNKMLNVMYVTDKGSTVTLTATAFTATGVSGTVIGKTAVAFVEAQNKTSGTVSNVNGTRKSTTFNFTTTGSGTLNYYVSGVATGKWEVVNKSGTVITTATATADGGLLTFSAPAGYVSLRPAN